ncbi:NADP-dependent oxidoreductase [Patulibacter americanus]|uniref:NADP-dependent oxidoreductase n=1 Tax=Patulibacter americanus TaxID=588672 RepID=UPI0003B6B7C5|nr:NADP-dependent oxidoreductase [Patulibacter americanus]
MRAVVVTQAGGPEVLEVQDRPDPEPGPGQVVVRLAAANINPTDIGARHGMFPPGFDIEGPPYTLGWDFAGEVVAVGPGVSDGPPASGGGATSPLDPDELAADPTQPDSLVDAASADALIDPTGDPAPLAAEADPGVGAWGPGDQVVGMIPWYVAGGRYGAYAELVLAEAAWIVARPETLSAVDAATIPLNALTAQQALGHLGAPQGAEILITGASGAVGAFAAQIAVAEDLKVTAIAGTDDEEFVASLGVARVLPRDADLSDIGRFKYVLDAVPLGADVFPAVDDGGVIVTTRPVKDEPGRRITQRPMLIEHDQELLKRLVEGVAAGGLVTRVAKTMPLEQAADAHRAVEERGRKGKIVLVP